MDGERGNVGFHKPTTHIERLISLAKRFRDKRYRDGYVAAHTRNVLARQMRNFRGDLSQAKFAELIGKRPTQVQRLENPAYTGWSLRTMIEIARKLNVGVIVRFVDFPTFLTYSGDLSDEATHPAPYNDDAIDALAEKAQRDAREMELRDLFVDPARSIDRSRGLKEGATNEADAGSPKEPALDRRRLSFSAL
jgi:Helix-turn-helix